jgi:ADP-ribose pyrophosphatase
MIDDGEYKTLNKTLVYSGRIFDLEKHEIKLPDNNIVNYDVINHKNAVGILPLDSNNNVWLVRQFRPAIGDYLLEIPAGLFDGEELPINAANRELQEEIGMYSNRLDYLGKYYLSPGFCTEMIYLYLARDMISKKLKEDADEFIDIQKIKLEDFYDMVCDHEITDSKTAMALMALRIASPFLR